MKFLQGNGFKGIPYRHSLKAPLPPSSSRKGGNGIITTPHFQRRVVTRARELHHYHIPLQRNVVSEAHIHSWAIPQITA